MDELRELALEVAHRILAAGTEAERCELGLENTNPPSVGKLVELAKQLLMAEDATRTAQGKDYGGAG